MLMWYMRYFHTCTQCVIITYGKWGVHHLQPFSFVLQTIQLSSSFFKYTVKLLLTIGILLPSNTINTRFYSFFLITFFIP